MIRFLLLFVLVLSIAACEKDPEISQPELPETGNDYYFPPLSGSTWASTTPESLNWDATKINELYSFLETNHSRAFIVLKEGKIVMEQYWGKNILNLTPFEQNTKWYWASAGKTLTAFLVGKAQEEGFLNIQDKSSDYLGVGWTSMERSQEDEITVWNQLTMTTGLDYQAGDVNCTEPACLQYRQDPGTQWFYHNAPYTLLESVVSQATNKDYNAYTDEKLETTIGLKGDWVKSGYNNIYWSTPRDAARFGLLILNKGAWDNTEVMTDQVYFDAMINTSQDLNPSYGYLWWLNGKSKVIYPGLPISFPVSISPNAPADLFAAMGKNGQIIDVIPSEDLVVVRMGDNPGDALVPVAFHDEMWEKIMAIIQ